MSCNQDKLDRLKIDWKEQGFSEESVAVCISSAMMKGIMAAASPVSENEGEVEFYEKAEKLVGGTK